MVNNFKIDEKLIEEALALSNYPTANLLIEAALREYIQRCQELKVLDLFGTIDYDEDYDYKQKQR